MLRAFDYIEYTEDSLEHQHGELFDEELKIAQAQVERSSSGGILPESCICGGQLTPFFDKWGVSYYRCKDCETLMAGAAPTEVQSYRESPELIGYRTQQSYQDYAAKRRDLNWEELIEWICLRSYRYLQKKQLEIIEFGGRYQGFSLKLAQNEFCAKYAIKDSIFDENVISTASIELADIVLDINTLQQVQQPKLQIRKHWECLKPGGLLFLSTRMGTGFDVLVLREHSSIFPYEHVLLPSMQLLKSLLESAGFEVLDIASPGRMDSVYVAKNSDKISVNDFFVKSLIERHDRITLQEFQRFLQRSGCTSYAQIVARKKSDRIG